MEKSFCSFSELISKLSQNYKIIFNGKKFLLCFSELMTWLSQKVRKTEQIFFHDKLSRNSEIINLLIQKKRVDFVSTSECNILPSF